MVLFYLTKEMIENVTIILLLGAVSFITSLAITPLLSDFLYRYRSFFGKQIRNDPNTPIFQKFHRQKEGTPTMGGILIWSTVIFITFFLWFLSINTQSSFLDKLNFLDRGQTFLPLTALIIGALFGLGDDIAGVFRVGPKGGGFPLTWKLILYTLVAIIGAGWFFYIGWDLLYVPFIGYKSVGLWYIPIFLFIIIGTLFSANETDGLDGLLGGVLLFAFGALAVVAFSQGKIALASFCGVIIGALLTFLWFNIYPARFFMGDTGSVSLGVTLGVIAMLTNSALFLPFFAFIPLLESISVLFQLFWKKVLGRRLFLSTPIHHHFEALDWSEPKVVMRFWIISAVMTAMGIVLYFMSMSVTGGLM